VTSKSPPNRSKTIASARNQRLKFFSLLNIRLLIYIRFFLPDYVFFCLHMENRNLVEGMKLLGSFDVYINE